MRVQVCNVYKHLTSQRTYMGVCLLDLCSKAEKAGLSLSKIEKLGLLSTAERLGLLSLADELLVTDPGKVRGWPARGRFVVRVSAGECRQREVF